jgi:hypothetical protein
MQVLHRSGYAGGDKEQVYIMAFKIASDIIKKKQDNTYVGLGGSFSMINTDGNSGGKKKKN